MTLTNGGAKVTIGILSALVAILTVAFLGALAAANDISRTEAQTMIDKDVNHLTENMNLRFDELCANIERIEQMIILIPKKDSK